MATFKNIIFAANSTDTSSMEAFNIILDELNYQDLHIGFYDFKLDGDSLSTAISSKVQQIKKEDLPDNDLIISIGGDGTMLQSAKLAHQFNIPITGINRGRLGFLTDILFFSTFFITIKFFLLILCFLNNGLICFWIFFLNS